MLFAVSLAEKLGQKGLTAVSLHPGVIVATSIGRNLNEDTMSELSESTPTHTADQSIGTLIAKAKL